MPQQAQVVYDSSGAQLYDATKNLSNAIRLNTAQDQNQQRARPAGGERAVSNARSISARIATSTNRYARRWRRRGPKWRR
jgi:hypothetical protein